jgi:phosphate transport system substrate-binding protein
MFMKKIAGFIAMLTLVTAAATAQAEGVKLNGSTTTIHRVINPYKDAVEAKTGHTLKIVGNATGKGLVDLVEGRCDASLSSAPIGVATLAANAAGKVVDIKTLKYSVLKIDEIVFAVHPANPVKSLDWAQIKAIHTGKITNWKEVGGNDVPILVYTDTPTGGTYALIKEIVLGGAEYSDLALPLSNVKRVGDMVASFPEAIGALGIGFTNSRIKIVETKKINFPLGIITVGEPRGKIKEVIDAYKSEVVKVGK